MKIEYARGLVPRGGAGRGVPPTKFRLSLHFFTPPPPMISEILIFQGARTRFHPGSASAITSKVQIKFKYHKDFLLINLRVNYPLHPYIQTYSISAATEIYVVKSAHPRYREKSLYRLVSRGPLKKPHKLDPLLPFRHKKAL